MLRDEDFFRIEGVPITKEEIRAISIGKLQLKPTDVVVDIGCGSGGMTVEIARRCKFVYAIDYSENAIVTTRKNLELFNIKNCKLIKGKGEEVIQSLKFNKAFVGGTKNIYKILDILTHKNTESIVINTIVLENTAKILNYFENIDRYNVEVVNVVVSYGKKINNGHMMLSKNPINIITCRLIDR
ncbi:MAG TPA: precorrin-6Y C5,15-methyltransferase (decarboxylating) subunit CbiT [Methanothermococcus okinawensis]|uniref:Probable cobalt-precorrin-6B C(15)-methyltransferase (decarboxylating) n=1 Tax=Methanofervidicoccus abyssi TaxID=2082189 RepID=A0A401HPU2_9EURY|nr:precorrin-6Y C5,15-methyltransferase (decarboxylating) subunit CbiT [Methanofervidicoccus abyssi]GBF36240.1 cobalt-precorrin-6B (C15)-methyltransferase [Methanofervidicoccus abyssi]HIP16537.1 precorrin-6Y C5,15-methyltransferase (decarboxylating) subunit CbiT [Methanothermococcus okinawensis]HIP34457.1 precorrin-6Y C5,15-methyltransferase (decarboxylating) subunit CbiT [Methanothermococcus okinawensis]